MEGSGREKPSPLLYRSKKKREKNKSSIPGREGGGKGDSFLIHPPSGEGGETTTSTYKRPGGKKEALFKECSILLKGAEGGRGASRGKDKLPLFR